MNEGMGAVVGMEGGSECKALACTLLPQVLPKSLSVVAKCQLVRNQFETTVCIVA